MKYLVILFFSLALFSFSANAQDYKKHTVAKGETISSIAKKYMITPYDIYRLNPDSKNGLKEDTILLIPNNPPKPLAAGTPVKEQPTKVVNATYTVLPKETFYSIAKKNNVAVADLEKANPDAVKNGLKTGQQLVIPIKGSGVAAQAKTAEKQQVKKDAPSYMFYTVVAGDTKYGIAKKYGMTVQLLEDLNPAVKDTLPLGYKLKLAKNEVVAEAKIAEPADKAVSAPAAPAQKTGFINYTVQPKETLYSITKDTGLTEQQLTALNPDLKDGLKEGMVLQLPAGTVISTPAQPAGSRGDLTKNLKKDQPKELALLIPFNLYRIESDTVRSKLLRTDKFVNLTLDFYAGAMVAIDSARTLGLPLKITILDAKETTKSSDIAALKSSLATADAIVGPFFQANAESTATLLPGIPVISPLAKESGTPRANLYYTIPSDDAMRKAMMDYVISKNSNVVLITDSKKASTRQYVKTNYPGVKVLESAITGDGIRALLVKDKTNYVVLDSETLTAVTGTTKMLEEAMVDYTIQLAVLDKNDKFDNDEVPLTRLVKLKMLYPSITNDAVTPQSQQFAKTFRAKNGFNPNAYVTRGFDVTFDAILRLFQQENFKDTFKDMQSAQVENKFSYVQQGGGNYNNGVFIMQYDEGLTIKEAQ